MCPWRRYTSLEFDEACLGLTPRRVGGADARSGSARHTRALDRPLELAACGHESRCVLAGGKGRGLGSCSFKQLAIMFRSFTFRRLPQDRGELLDRARRFGGRCLGSSAAGHDPSLVDSQ